MGIKLDYININKTYDSGQVFRWYPEENSYIAIIGNSAYRLNSVKGEVNIDKIAGSGENLARYFDLDRDYKKLNKDFIKKHTKLKDVVEFGKGIVILKQDELEMMITFMISANNHISRIRNTVEAISKAKGNFICTIDDRDFYSFPTLEKLKELSEEDFKSMGAGYRANYLYETIQKLNNSDIDEMESMSTESLIKKLKTYKGIGIKVAECTALFGFARFEVFPIDTWMKKAVKNFYGIEDFSEKNLINIKNLFGDYRALLQQYMFYYMREGGQNK